MEVKNVDAQQEVQYVGFWLRFGAYVIDYLALLFIYLITSIPDSIFTTLLVLAVGRESAEAQILRELMPVVYIIGYTWLYYSLMESSKTQATLGKMAFGLIVTDKSGGRLSFGRATGRFFAKYLSELIFHIGYLMASFTKRKQALHDFIAETLVIHK